MNKLMKKLNIIPLIKFKYKIQHKTKIFKIMKKISLKILKHLNKMK